MPKFSRESLQKLQLLKEKYRASLPDKLAHLESLWLKCQQHDFSSIKVDELAQALHKLSGSAALYDYPQIGSQAKQLENMLRQVAPPVAGDIENLTAAMAILQAAIEQAK